MKINVPFYKSEEKMDCGPVALKMALEYLGEKHSKEELAKLVKQTPSGITWSLGIVRAAKKLGFRAKIISIENFSTHEEIDYYKEYAQDKAMKILNDLKEEVKKLNIEDVKKDISLNELIKYVSEDSIPIALVNWKIISGKKGFSGHFLPVTGYDEKNIYVHNPGVKSPMAYLPVKRELFVKAWESEGTDKDLIIIFRKLK